MDAPPIVPGRACRSCTMCCWVLGIEELAKPERTSCHHCEAGTGCGIYAERPTVCREFHCGYLVLPFVHERWFPEECGMMVFPAAADRRLAVHVDPARPDAWRSPPFHADLRQWAAAAERMGFQVFVAVGRRVIAILPHEDVDLGLFEDDDRLVYEREAVGGQVTTRARKVSGRGAPTNP